MEKLREFLLSLETIIFYHYSVFHEEINYQKLIELTIELEYKKSTMIDTKNFLSKQKSNAPIVNVVLNELESQMDGIYWYDYSFENINEIFDLQFNIKNKQLKIDVNELRESNPKSVVELVDIYMELFRNDVNLDELTPTQRIDIDYLIGLLVMNKIVN